LLVMDTEVCTYTYRVYVYEHPPTPYTFTMKTPPTRA